MFTQSVPPQPSTSSPPSKFTHLQATPPPTLPNLGHLPNFSVEGAWGQSGYKRAQGLVWMLHLCSASCKVNETPALHLTECPGGGGEDRLLPLGASTGPRPRGSVHSTHCPACSLQHQKSIFLFMRTQPPHRIQEESLRLCEELVSGNVCGETRDMVRR